MARFKRGNKGFEYLSRHRYVLGSKAKGSLLQNQRESLALRLARLAIRCRDIGRVRHAALSQHTSVDRQMPRSEQFSFRLQNSHYRNWPIPGQTLTTLVHLEARPCRVRLIYFNDQSKPWTVDGAALAPSAAVGDGHTPVNADGVADPSLWRRVTFNNGGLDLDPLAQLEGEAYALTLPAN